MRNLNAGEYAVKMYSKDADIDDFVNKLCGVPTYKLIEELTEREGVDVIYGAPYDRISIERTGPCIVLIVED